ncbi:hypothetical protein [Ensifer sp. OTU672]|uniref:hypothetical protein n=1 Tax=Ensifer sp. OTU672 TaxID=3043861 RepID=UPI00313BBD03
MNRFDLYDRAIVAADQPSPPKRSVLNPMGSLNAHVRCASRLVSSALATEPRSPAGKTSCSNFQAGMPEGTSPPVHRPHQQRTAAATHFFSPAVHPLT